jgi:chromosome segregation and condensation protein ScpB
MQSRARSFALESVMTLSAADAAVLCLIAAHEWVTRARFSSEVPLVLERVQTLKELGLVEVEATRNPTGTIGCRAWLTPSGTAVVGATLVPRPGPPN